MFFKDNESSRDVNHAGQAVWSHLLNSFWASTFKDKSPSAPVVNEEYCDIVLL